MASQFRKASVSIAANIAEGYGRYYFQGRIRFCYLARGSLEEVATLLILAQDLGYLRPELAGELAVSVRGLRRKLNGYIRFLRGRSAVSPSSLIAKGRPGGDLDEGDESP